LNFFERIFEPGFYAYHHLLTFLKHGTVEKIQALIFLVYQCITKCIINALYMSREKKLNWLRFVYTRRQLIFVLLKGKSYQIPIEISTSFRITENCFSLSIMTQQVKIDCLLMPLYIISYTVSSIFINRFQQMAHYSNTKFDFEYTYF
jgi:hypothetical protein